MQNTSSKRILTIVAVLVGVVIIISGVVWYRSAHNAKNNAAATALSGQNGAENSAGGNAPAAPAPINASPAGTPEYVKG